MLCTVCEPAVKPTVQGTVAGQVRQRLSDKDCAADLRVQPDNCIGPTSERTVASLCCAYPCSPSLFHSSGQKWTPPYGSSYTPHTVPISHQCGIVAAMYSSCGQAVSNHQPTSSNHWPCSSTLTQQLKLADHTN